jgi:hypothetical protein
VASAIPAFREVSRLAPAGRITVVHPDAEGEDLARAILTAAARGRTSPLGPYGRTPGWSIPTWDSLVDGVLEVYRRVATSPSGQAQARSGGTNTKSDT